MGGGLRSCSSFFVLALVVLWSGRLPLLSPRRRGGSWGCRGVPAGGGCAPGRWWVWGCWLLCCAWVRGPSSPSSPRPPGVAAFAPSAWRFPAAGFRVVVRARPGRCRVRPCAARGGRGGVGWCSGVLALGWGCGALVCGARGRWRVPASAFLASLCAVGAPPCWVARSSVVSPLGWVWVPPGGPAARVVPLLVFLFFSFPFVFWGIHSCLEYLFPFGGSNPVWGIHSSLGDLG